ncbi:MDR family MFS transporter [Hyalangium versicolor]|uniref:MDR family MFS transporter n=1 Tax=Hyalangium versicolor TaxID=2861190 RepID=UPI001CCC8D03|nr:MFS transporter [Hyalangium versicolor]
MASVPRDTLRSRFVEQVRITIGGLPSTYWFLWTGTLVNRIGGFVVPFLALYLTRERGFSEVQAGLVVSLYGFGAMFSALLGGTLADRLGRRLALGLGLWLAAGAMLFLGFCRDPLWIRVGAFALGLLGDLYRPAVFAAISDVVQPQDRIRAFSLLYWVVNVGFAIAVPLGGFVAQGGFLTLFVADAITTFLYGCVVWFKVPETLTQRAPSRSLLPSPIPFLDKIFLAFWLPNLLVAFLFFQSQAALALDLASHGMGTAQYGTVMAVNGVLIVLAQPFISRLVARRRRSAVLAAGAIFTGVGFGLHALSTTVPLAMFAVSIWTLGEILGATMSASVVADLAPVHLRGSYQGAFSMSWGLASCLSPMVGSWVLSRFGGATLWGACLLVGLLAGVWHLAAAGARRRHLEVLRTQQGIVGAALD